MEWIKATQQLPENKNNVPIKVKGVYDTGWYNKDVNRFCNDYGGIYYLENVEWLSESTPTPLQGVDALPVYDFDVAEIGEDGLKELRKNLKFGDIVVNDWASKGNPNRVGVFISHDSGKGIKVTNMKGSSWVTLLDKQSRSKIIGSVLAANRSVDVAGGELNVLPSIFFTIPIDVEGSNIDETGWMPTDEDKSRMPIESYNDAVEIYKEQNAKVLFKNASLCWESCDCGDGYGCSHGSYVTDISIMNGEVRHEIYVQDGEDLIIENKTTKESLSIPISSTIGDFHRACKLIGIELELTDYAKSLAASLPAGKPEEYKFYMVGKSRTTFVGDYSQCRKVISDVDDFKDSEINPCTPDLDVEGLNLLPVFESIINKRISDSFDDGFHNWAKKALLNALASIKENIPPSYFDVAAPDENKLQGLVDKWEKSSSDRKSKFESHSDNDLRFYHKGRLDESLSAIADLKQLSTNK